MAISREIIYYKPNRGKHGDLYGEDGALDGDELRTYFDEYAKFCDGAITGGASRKVVSDTEFHAAKRILGVQPSARVRKTTQFERMHVAVADTPRLYKNWLLYSHHTQVKEGAVVFADDDITPSSAAEFLIDPGADMGAVSAIELQFTVDKRYYAPILPHVIQTMEGKCIELRTDDGEALKLQLYTNGQMYAKILAENGYSYKLTYVGDFIFDCENTLTVELHADSYTVILNDKTTANIPLGGGDIRSLFLCNGRYASGDTHIRPVCIRLSRGEIRQFFSPEPAAERPPAVLGEHPMPYVLGTQALRGKQLILTGEFEPLPGAAYLNIGTIDPCGEVRINGKTVCTVKDFMPLCVNIDRFILRGQTNTLTIVVSPRAPQNFYSWHRHKDLYTGWFANRVSISYLPETHLDELRVETHSVEPQLTVSVKAKVRGGSAERFSYRLFLREIHEGNPAETEIVPQAVAAHGDEVAVTFCGQARLWSPQTPVVYDVRLVLVGKDGSSMDDVSAESGFRTIAQRGGHILLNGKRTRLKGALIMQFLPPYEEIPLNHICPSNEQILWQLLAAKQMNSNSVRLHMLGRGSNDPRYAQIAGRLGIMLVWVTRLIDAAENMKWAGEWRQAEAFKRQMCEVINYPAVIMWEGANELYLSCEQADKLYDSFVSAVKSVDTSRLICPCSHLYYGGGMYEMKPCQYYQDDGKRDQHYARRQSSHGWTDALVVRSAHTYETNLGYGESWSRLRRRTWRAERSLLKSKAHAYIVSEVAVIGYQDPSAGGQPVNNKSYETDDFRASLGFDFSPADWKQSQAFQAVCANAIVKTNFLRGADGLFWCCLSGGANNASYLKPPIDFYGYAKYAFYMLKQGFADTTCFCASTDVVYKKNQPIRPVLMTDEAGSYRVEITIKNARGDALARKAYPLTAYPSGIHFLKPWRPRFPNSGVYIIEFSYARNT